MTDRLKMIEKLKVNDKGFYALSEDERGLVNNVMIKSPDNVVRRINQHWYKSQVQNTIQRHDAEIYRIHKDYTEPKPKVGKWVDFDVDENGEFIVDRNGGCEITYSCFDEIGECIENTSKIKSFGGIQYIEPVSGDTSDFTGDTYTCYFPERDGFWPDNPDDGVERFPVFPHKIKFWIVE